MVASPLFKVRFLLFTGSIRCSALTVPSPLPVWTTTTTPPPLVPCCHPPLPPTLPRVSMLAPHPLAPNARRKGPPSSALPRVSTTTIPPLPSSATLPSPISTTRPPSHPPPSRLDDDAPSPRPKRETEGGSTPPPPSPRSLSRSAAPFLAFGARWTGALHLHIPYLLPRARFRAPPPSSCLRRDGGGETEGGIRVLTAHCPPLPSPLPRLKRESDGSFSSTAFSLASNASWRGLSCRRLHSVH
ncbi:hypothetical protein DFH94DRAFT_857397 [Russula ochroleuca]|uniref:Uncharacterized protein n=1 Tax=Russula ochroleuca TaxID=152965 RepID=A0A9P5JVI9_9AGAM|nr:hypothetical protein DFH94DRAFT_857397 [Russula ochroleuca]